jgi:hypothetical protein
MRKPCDLIATHQSEFDSLLISDYCVSALWIAAQSREARASQVINIHTGLGEMETPPLIGRLSYTCGSLGSGDHPRPEPDLMPSHYSLLIQTSRSIPK